MPQKTLSINFKTSGFRRASRQMSQVGDEADEAGSNLETAGTVGKAAIGAIATAVTGAVAGMSKLVSSTAEYAREVDNAASQSGMTAESIQEIAFAAEQVSGTSFDTTRDGLKELAIRSQEAANGTGEAKEAFDQLGISQQFLQDASTAEIFQRVRQELQGASSRMRTFAAETIFGGEAGEQLTEVLGLSTQQMQKLRSEAQSSGKVLSGSQVQALENARSAWSSFTSSVQGAGRQLGARLAPLVTSTLIPALRSMVGAVRSTVQAVTSMSDTTKGIVATVTGLTAAISAGFAIWSAWPAIIGAVTTAFGGLTTAASTAWAAITSPITGVIAAVAAVAATAGLIIDNWEGLSDFFSQTFDVISDLASTFGTLLFEIFRSAWLEVKALFLDAIDGLIEIINDGLRAVGAEDMTIDSEFGMSQDRLDRAEQRVKDASSAFGEAASEAGDTMSTEFSDAWGAVKQSTSDAVSWIQGQMESLGEMVSLPSLPGGEQQQQEEEEGGGGSGSGAGSGQQQATPIAGLMSFGSSGSGAAGGGEFTELNALDKMKRKLQSLGQIGKTTSKALSRGFSRATQSLGRMAGRLATGEDLFRSLADVGKQMVQQLISALTQLITKMVITFALKQALNLATGGGSAAFTSVVSPGTSGSAILSSSSPSPNLGGVNARTSAIQVQVEGETRTDGRDLVTTYDKTKSTQNRLR